MIPNLSPVAHNAPEEYLCREESSEVVPPAQSAGAAMDLKPVYGDGFPDKPETQTVTRSGRPVK